MTVISLKIFKIFYHLRIFYSDNPDLLTIINDMTCKNFLSLSNSFYSDILDLLTNLKGDLDNNFYHYRIFYKKILGKNFFPRFQSQNDPLAKTLPDWNLIKYFLLKKRSCFPFTTKPLKPNKTVASLPKPLSRYSSILSANSYILFIPKSFLNGVDLQ